MSSWWERGIDIWQYYVFTFQFSISTKQKTSRSSLRMCNSNFQWKVDSKGSDIALLVTTSFCHHVKHVLFLSDWTFRHLWPKNVTLWAYGFKTRVTESTCAKTRKSKYKYRDPWARGYPNHSSLAVKLTFQEVQIKKGTEVRNFWEKNSQGN